MPYAFDTLFFINSNSHTQTITCLAAEDVEVDAAVEDVVVVVSPASPCLDQMPSRLPSRTQERPTQYV